MTTLTPGYKNFHADTAFNFMMNRMHWVIPAEELFEVSRTIGTFDDWIREMSVAGARAAHEGRHDVAAKFYLGAEFYMAPDAPGKRETYERFLELYNQANPQIAAMRTTAPYETGELPVIEAPAEGQERSVILAHSGFDGLAEEMYPALTPLTLAGYRVIAFEGPGQGGALRLHNLHMPFDWERPVRAVLDHFQIESCTLIGMSLGGYLAPRAAAFEPRIKRVVSWGAMFDFAGCFEARIGAERFSMLTQMLDQGERQIVNDALEAAGQADPTSRWATGHGMHVSGAKDPFEFMQWVRTLNLRDVSDRIGQDSLIVMGAEDHLVPAAQLYEQAAALTNARSVTARMMTAAEHGAQHCQIGNPLLVTDLILSWMDGLDQRDQALSDVDPQADVAA
jgi:pimeloyl-ACP methyl ester carboxylesterase